MNETQQIIKKDFPDLIYQTAKIEAQHSTLKLTKAIINETFNGNPADYTVRVISAIQRAYQFIVDIKNISTLTIDLSFVENINRLVGVSQNEWQEAHTGHIRQSEEENAISVGDYIPPKLKRSKVEQELKAIVNQSDHIKAGLELVLFICKNQLFVDGNKRTAFVVANATLAKFNQGALFLSPELDKVFLDYLADYYQNEEIKEELLEWMKPKLFRSINEYDFADNQISDKDNAQDLKRLENAWVKTVDLLIHDNELKPLIENIEYDDGSLMLTGATDKAILINFKNNKRQLIYFSNNQQRFIINERHTTITLKKFCARLLLEAMHAGINVTLVRMLIKSLHL